MSDTATTRPTRIALSGSTGLVGSALSAALRRGGREVRPIVRRAGDAQTIHWDTEQNRFDAEALTACDAVVHLAGEPIVGRWTDEKKKRVRASRVDGARSPRCSLPSSSASAESWARAISG